MANIGTLVTRVFTSRTQLPIAGAAVTIIKWEADGSFAPLAARTSDQNGKTAPVAIETPDIMKSLSPNMPQGYAVVDVRVAHPDYTPLEIRGIQIFPEVQSIQEIPMLPLSRQQRSRLQ